ncbi:MAG: carboxypeptidase-like regulatory domain-containing protein [Terracidiphilus sp.]
MTRRVHLVVFAALIALGSGPESGAAPGSVSGSVSGQVRDSAGVPQISAQVQLLRPDLTVIASVYTDSSGRYSITSILPGRYAVKAMGAWFLPSLRENVRVHANTVVNLTLNSFYEAMQWLPAEPRAGNSQKDDWAWTLRSAANRPLLRWLEDGPLVVVADGSGTHPRLKARLVATGEEGTFGEYGERITTAVEETPSDSRELLASVDFAPGTNGSMESMLGFRQDLGFAGSVQSVAAVALRPEVAAGGAEGLDEVVIRSWETMHLGDEFEGEAGSDQVLARLSSTSPQTVAAVLPFASVGWRDGNSTVRYRITTFLPGGPDAEDSEARSWLPGLSAHNGKLAIEHGLHQELGWERRTDLSGVAVVVFADRIDNPVIEAMSHFAEGNSSSAAVLLDPSSGLLHAAGPEFSTAGLEASIERRVAGRNHLRVSYANGNALVLAAAPSSPQSATLAQVLAAAHPRRTQTYALSLSGTLDGTKTRWRASYRWQPEDTITQVAPFAVDAAAPWFSLHLRQPIHLCRNGCGDFEALLDVGNLMAQGYRPYLLSDGSLLIFAQEQRSIRAGLAFNF